MTLTDHLRELRTRLIWVAAILFIAFGVCYNFGIEVQNALLKPLKEALGDSGQIMFTGLLDKVLTQFQLAFWSALITSSPFWFSQIWFFIKPGLYEKEVKIIRPFIFLSFILFIAGVAFGYYIVFPFTFQTMLEFGVNDIEAMISLKEYVVLTSKVLVFLGLLFQLPNVLLIAGFMGLVSGKQLLSWARYVLTGFAVVSALLTPPDPITMMALWVPLTALYFFGTLLVFLFVDPWKKKKNKDLETYNPDSSRSS